MTACLCILGGLLAVCGDVVCKRWADGGAPWVLVAGCGVYALDACVWAAILRRGVALSTGSVAWAATGLLLSFVAGVVVYGERPQPRKCAGALFALLGVLMVGGCTRSSEVKAEEKIAVQEEVKARSTEQTAETVQTGPGRTVVYKFGPKTDSMNQSNGHVAINTNAQGGNMNHSSAHAATISGLNFPLQSRSSGSGIPYLSVSGNPDQANSMDAILDGHGPLVEMDVIDTGPVTDTKSAVTQTAKTASLTGKQESTSDTKRSTKWGLPWAAWLIGGLLVAGTAYAAWRFGLLGKAMRLLG